MRQRWWFAGVAALLAVAAAPPVTIPRDTPVALMVMREVSSRDAPGTRFKLRTTEPVTLGGTVVVPRGTLAWGEVVRAEASGPRGRGGSIAIRLLYLKLGDRRLALDGESAVQARDMRREATIAAAGMGALAPLGLMMRGNSARVKAGEMLTGFVAADTVIYRVDPVPVP